MNRNLPRICIGLTSLSARHGYRQREVLSAGFTLRDLARTHQGKDTPGRERAHTQVRNLRLTSLSGSRVP
eukprot:2447983-Pleurochrysis_carterae.AAC.1